MTDAAEWRGRVGQAWAAEWRRTDRSFAGLTGQLLTAIDAAAPREGRAVDIGCGAGETSLALATMRPDLQVTGIDLSADLVAVARRRAVEQANLDFAVGDAVTESTVRAPLALMVSRHGVMFFPDPVAAFAGLRAASAPGGRLVFSCFRDWASNAFARDIAELFREGPPPADAPGPFAFADRSRIESILSSAGWREVAIEAFDFAFRVGEGPDAVAEGTDFFTRIGPAARLLREAPEGDRPGLLQAIARRCEARHAGGAVDFPAAAWIVSAAA